MLDIRYWDETLHAVHTFNSPQLCNSARPSMSQSLFTECAWSAESLTGSPRVLPAKGCNLSPECPWGRGSHYWLGRRRCKQSVSAGRQRCSFAQIHLSSLTLTSDCLFVCLSGVKRNFFTHFQGLAEQRRSFHGQSGAIKRPQSIKINKKSPFGKNLVSSHFHVFNEW